MDKKEMFQKMQMIEFVLFSLDSQSQLKDGEIEMAYKVSREILEQLHKEVKNI